MAQENDTDLLLVLGCFGRKDNNFCTCTPTENIILKINPNLEKIRDLIFYLKSLGLFELPITNINVVRRAVFYIQDNFYQVFKPIWAKDYFTLLENFILMHKNCGVYLKLILPIN